MLDEVVICCCTTNYRLQRDGLKQQTFIIPVCMGQKSRHGLLGPFTLESLVKFSSTRFAFILRLNSACRICLYALYHGNYQVFKEPLSDSLADAGFSSCGPLHGMPKCSQDMAGADPSDREKAMKHPRQKSYSLV